MRLKTITFYWVLSSLLQMVLFSFAVAEENHAPDDSKSSLSAASISVVAHESAKVKHLTLNQLRAIFSLRVKKWPNGTPISVFVLNDEHRVHRKFLRDNLKMLPHQLRRQWDRYVYSGTGQGPMQIDSEDDMLARIKSTPGAIGYSQLGEIDENVITIDVR